MTREEMLKEATKIVTKNRQDQYGSPEDCFNQIAALWDIYLDHPVTPADVCAMMMLLKMVRAKFNPKYQDNWVDIAGYSACACEISTNKPLKS